MSAFLDTAVSIALRLCRDAIWAGDRCNWVGPAMEGSGWTIVHKSLGPDLYSGASGIALFLAEIATRTGERLVRKTARGAAAQASSRAEDIPPSLRIGFYSGLTGIAWALERSGALIGEQALRDRGSSLMEQLRSVDIDQQPLDVLSGCAGAIPVLLSLARWQRRPEFTDLAVRCGERLLNTAVRENEGWSWKTIDAPGMNPSRNLTGYSHGAAGIGWALLELGHATADARFCAAAFEAFRYERSHYSAQFENWPDFRDYLRPPEQRNTLAYANAWCHGAPGIGLSRLRAWELTRDPVCMQETEIAVRATSRSLESPQATTAGFSLCHGCAGNADLLIEAARVMNEPGHRARAEAVAQAGIEQFEAQRLPWPCGIPGAGETPSLMLGTAGIGYFYLRLDDPQLSSVLLLCPESG
jgi:type 2 lantibiotic biosynthesis protein LanM